MTNRIICGSLAMALGALGAWVILRLGWGFGLVDRPSMRSSHLHPTPKGGGIGILAAFCLGALWLDFPPGIWLPAAGLSVISLVGDRFEISPQLRLLVQFVAAGTACWQITRNLPHGFIWLKPGLLLGMALAVLFVVGSANIYNFMDGINGIAGIVGLIAFALLAGTGWLRGEPLHWVMMAFLLAAACAGFLPFNYPRARVFMGDVGSILLGFLFAIFVVAWSRTLADLIMFCLFLFPFFTDEFMTLLPRLRDGDALVKPHRRHIYQILVNQMKMPHWAISFLYGTVQAGVAGVAIWIHPWGWPAEVFWLILVLGAAWVLATRVREHEIQPK